MNMKKMLSLALAGVMALSPAEKPKMVEPLSP